MKKFLALVCTLCLLLTALPLTALAADDDWVTLNVEMYDRSIAGFNVEDCWQLRYIQENFGNPNHIKINWIPVSRWEEGTILSTRLAGGTAPDICMTYGTDLVQQYIDMGGIMPLDDLLAEYGQELTAFLGDEVLQYGQYDVGDGKEQYFLPARRIVVATQSMFIRKDWLEKLGMEVPTNVEELYAYLKAAKEQKLGGDNTIPYSSDLYAADPFYGWIYQMDAFLDYSQITEEDWVANFKFHYMLPGAKEALRWMNKFFNEGLVSDYFGIENSKQTDSDRVNGYDGFWVGNWDAPWRMEKSYAQDLAKNVPGASWIACDPFKPEDGTTPHETYTAAGQAIFIPASVDEKVAVAAIKYLNWMCKPESLYALQNGEKGYNYTTVNENNIPTDLKNINDTDDAHKMHATDGAPICNGFYYGSDELNYAATAMGFPGYEDVVADSLVIANDGAYEPVSFTRTIQSRIDYGTTIVSKEAELLVQVVTCKPEDFDATWDGEGGGVLLNQCPHQLDLLQWLCGLPVRVRAACHEGKWHDIEVEDDVTAYLEFANGATGTFIASTGDALGENRLEIIGTRARIRIENDQLTLDTLSVDERDWCPVCKEPFGVPEIQHEIVQTDGENPQHAGVLNAFAAHILHGTPLVADGREGIRGLMLSNAMHLSSWTNQTVSLPIDEELFLKLLNEKRRTSRHKDEVDAAIDVSGSFGSTRK